MKLTRVWLLLGLAHVCASAYARPPTAKFEGWRIFVSQCTARGWSDPVPPIFAADGVEADPWFTSDGRHLYFISTRSIDGVRREDLFSPSGASLLFSRDTGSPLSGEFFLWHIRGDESWPSPCPAPVGKS